MERKMTTPLSLLGPWPDEQEMEFRAYQAKAHRENAEQEAQAAANAAALQHDFDRIDQMALGSLKDELLALRSKSRTTKRQRQDYAAYRAYALEHGWPETAAQCVFAFLLKNISRGLPRVKRLHKSILKVQVSLGHRATAEDLIVTALLLKLETEAKEK